MLRDTAFPRAVYRQTWERLSAQRPEREACKTMVGLLVLAADGHEAQLAQELQQLIELDQLPDLCALSLLLQPPSAGVPPVVVKLPTLAGSDRLAPSHHQTLGRGSLRPVGLGGLACAPTAGGFARA